MDHTRTGTETAYKSTAEKLIRYRWLLAAFVFIICVLLKLHGSSIGMFNEYLPTQEDPVIAQQYHLAGKTRYIRSDEWAVQTPTYFSQYYSDYSLYSDNMGINEENMILDYYAPAKSIVTIGKPLNWGYMLLGNEYGLSWYWCGLVILIFMTSFEMFMILTEKDISISLLGSLMIGLSPAVQWWMSPHIPIVYMYAAALFIIGYHLFAHEKESIKWLMALLAVIALTGFIFSIFPAVQVIAGIVAFTLLCCCLARDRVRLVNKSTDIVRIVSVIMSVGIISLIFILQSKDDFSALLGTSYPGSRLILGGYCSFKDIFTNLCNFLLPQKEPNILNSPELADFIHIGPVCMLLYPVKIRPALKKSNDRSVFVGSCLFILILIEYVFMLLGFPEIIARITLFTFNNRMKLSCGWTSVIFTVWCIYIISKKRLKFTAPEMIIITVSFAACYALTLDSAALEYLSLPIAIVFIAVMSLIVILALTGSKTPTVLLISAVMLFSGIGVNPVSRGISPITNHPISSLIHVIRTEEPDAKWIAEGGLGSWVLANFAMANGAEVVNGTTFYPVGDYDIIDPEGIYTDQYNRYLNEAVHLEDADVSTPELISPDLVYIHMSFDDLKALNIRYVITDRDLTADLTLHGIKCELLLTQDLYYVYRIDY